MSAKNRFLHFQGAGRIEQGATATVTAIVGIVVAGIAGPARRWLGQFGRWLLTLPYRIADLSVHASIELLVGP